MKWINKPFFTMNRTILYVVTAGIGFVLTGCGGSDESVPDITIPDKGNTVNDIKAVMSQLNIPGVSIAVIDNYEVVELLALGVADQTTQEVVTEQTVFQAASISKTVTAVATVKWTTDSQIPLDTSINELLTDWQLPENNLTTVHKPTIEGVLRHTAGMNVSGFPGYNVNKPIPTLLQILTGEAKANTEAIEVTIEPNRKWRYSGGGYTVLQQVIENQTNMTFQEFINWQVIDFLGLNNSTFEQVDSADHLTRSSGHINGDSPINGSYHMYPEQAAAGYWTNANDLARFAIHLQLSLKGESQLLSPMQAQKMLTHTLSSNYGVGVELFDKGSFGHTGSNAGFRSLMTLNSNGFGIIILTNSDKGSDLASTVVKILSKKYGQ